MSPLQHIVFVSHSLSSGGAEHVLCRMANYWAACGRDTTIITLAGADSDFYPLDHRVRRVALNLAADSLTPMTAIKNNLSRLQRLRAEIKRSNPDVVISFVDCTNVLTLLATRGLRVAVIVSERIDPRQHAIGAAWNLLRDYLYPRAEALVVQSAAVRRWAEDIAPSKRVYVIPNSVSTAAATDDDAPAGVAVPGPFVVAIGRLEHQKGFDLLIDAFSRCIQTRGDWSLVIIGEGAERERLTDQVKRLGMANHVHLPGRLKTPAALLRQASLFVLSSRYEGFPNALLEAMSCGLPVISFDCPSGPGEIIRHGVDGVLVPSGDTAALSDVMGQLMDDETERRRLGERATRVAERFSIDKVMALWEQVIHAAVGQRCQRKGLMISVRTDN